MGQSELPSLALLRIQADIQDLMRKEYMGEVNIPFSQWFPSGDAQLWTDNLPVCLTIELS